MKNILVENMLRFSPKNLDSKTIKKLQQMIEQTETPVATTPETQTTTKITNSKIGNIDIPGFLFAEDDSEWLQSKGNKTTGEMLSNENLTRIYDYYNASSTSADPASLFGKYAIIFNYKNTKGLWPYQKDNLYNATFQINTIYRTKGYNFAYILSSQGINSLHIVVPKLKTEQYFQIKQDGGLSVAFGVNPVMNLVGDKLISADYESLDPKYKLQKQQP